MIRYITVNLGDNHIEGYSCITDISKKINMSEIYVVNAIHRKCLVGHGGSACWVLRVPGRQIFLSHLKERNMNKGFAYATISTLRSQT